MLLSGRRSTNELKVACPAAKSEEKRTFSQAGVTAVHCKRAECCRFFLSWLQQVTEIDWVIKSAHVRTQNRYASVNACTYTTKSPLSLLTEAAYTPNVWSCTFSSSSTHTSHSTSEIKQKWKIFVSVFTRGLFPHALTPWPHHIVHFTTQKNTLQNSGTTISFF